MPMTHQLLIYSQRKLASFSQLLFYWQTQTFRKAYGDNTIFTVLLQETTGNTQFKSINGLRWSRSECRECVFSTRCMSCNKISVSGIERLKKLKLSQHSQILKPDWGHENRSHNVPDSCLLHQAIGGKKGRQGEGQFWLTCWIGGRQTVSKLWRRNLTSGQN